MSDIIHLLPDAVANQIAAGEVIQRPASVLKELVENAVDAGATSIQVLIKDAGRTLIQVTDNGKGMSETDARMAFERHATSKIKDAQDLFALRTMGFRGEALASIAAISQIEMRTRRAPDELGVLIEIAGTRVFRQERIQCEQGTTFMIKNLFFNVPARRRFLKSDNVEKSHLLSEFYRIVLVNPNVEFAFYDGTDEMYRLPVSTLKMRIENVFSTQKKRIQQQLLNIETSTGLVTIVGFVGKPEYAQKSAPQYFFVNGRFMRHPYFHKAVMLAYHQLIQPTENPSYFIYFEVDPQSIDINIHPTKTEIKFENEQAIWSILSAAVKESLGKFNVIPSIDFDRTDAIDIPLQAVSGVVKPPQTVFNPTYNPFNTSYKRPAFDWDTLYTGFQQTDGALAVHKSIPVNDDPAVDTPRETIEQLFADSQPLQQELKLGHTSQSSYFQYKGRFIITAIKSGMLIVDQHRAHFRVMYEAYLRNVEFQQIHSQQLLFPEILELQSQEFLIYELVAPVLQQLGFTTQVIGKNVVQISGIPGLLPVAEVCSWILMVLEQVANTEFETIETVREQMALALAKSSAIKSGQHLAVEEMNDLIDRLFACSNTNFTPDGKSIHATLSHEELIAKFS